MVMKEGREVLAEALRSEGVEFIFGLPGGQSVDILYDALDDSTKPRPILVRHEQSASFMAYAYSRLRGEPGVCHGTVGPGVHNMVAGIAEAWSASIPVIAICPQVRSDYEWKGALQEFPQIQLMAPFTKWAVRISNPEKIAWTIRRAFQIACCGRPGPVFVEISSEVGSRKTEDVEYVRSIRPIRTRPDQRDLAEACELILKAERPIIVAGGGVYLSRAFSELRNFAEVLCIPVLTTASGKGAIDEDHPLSAGLIGLYRTKVSRKIWNEADLIIGVGTRFEQLESGNWNWFPEKAKLITVNIDATEVGLNWVPDVALVGDAKLALRDLIDSLAAKVRKDEGSMSRIEQLRALKREYEIETLSASISNDSPIKPLRVMKELRALMEKDAIVCHENGSIDIWSYSHLPILEGGMSVMPGGQTCMGFGVAAAIGAKLSLPNRQVVCVTGDGAFQMMAKELPTAAQYRASATWCIMNNFSLGWVKFSQKHFYREHYVAVDFDVQPDFPKIAEASKCYGERVEKPGDIGGALKRAFKANEEGKPAVLDFLIDGSDLPPGFLEFYGVE
ncbi:MAG: thiamine pyrophosphate-binding protein [Thermoproteota archaeon]